MAKEDLRIVERDWIDEEESQSRGTGGASQASPEGDNPSPEDADGSDQEKDVSPFLPDTNIQYAWDSTSLGYLKRCPRLYYYTIICGWRPRQDNVNLRFGGEFHQVAQDYEKLKAEGIKHNEAVFLSIKNLLYRVADWDPDHKYKNREYLVRTAVWYLEKYKDDVAKTHILNNGKPAVELSFKFELNWCPEGWDQPYVLCGHMDRIVDFHEELLVNDYKTTTTTPGPYYWDQFEPDNQMTLYTLASKVIFEPSIKGVLITSAQIMVDGTRFTRGITYRTQDQLDEWLDDLEFWLDRARFHAESGMWPMNDTACDKYGGCTFRHICNKSPGVRESFLRSDFVKDKPWNPLIPRE